MEQHKCLNCIKQLKNDILKESQRSRLLTIQEAAQILKIHRSTVSRYVLSGELKAYRIGRRVLIKEEDLWTFIENRIVSEYVAIRS
jgi:excisionase family DNA binding protein